MMTTRNSLSRRLQQRFALLLLMLLTAGSRSLAQDADSVLTVERATLVGIGYGAQLDSYLSPEDYGGADLSLLSLTERRRPQRRWQRQLTHQAHVWWGSYRSDQGSEISGDYSFSYAWLRQLATLPLGNGRISLKAGPAAAARLGFVYNTRNSNNPAQAKLALACAPTGIAEWDFTAGRLPLRLRGEVVVPLLGLMFSPQYGQSYYEIFSRGNYDHNLVLTTPFNAPSVQARLLVGTRWRRLNWQVGFQTDCLQAKVNHLKYHRYNYLLLLGVSKTLRVL